MDLCSSSSCWSRVNCSFTVLKIACVLSIHPSLTLSSWTFSNHQSLYCIHSFAFSECHGVGIIHSILFADWFLSLSNMHCRFLHVLITLFLISENILLDWYTSVCLSICPLKNILVAPKLWQFWKSCFKHSCIDFIST